MVVDGDQSQALEERRYYNNQEIDCDRYKEED